MTPADIKSARHRLGISQAGLAEALRLGPNGERTVRRWETGDVPVTGPASVAIEYMVAGTKRKPAAKNETGK
jgi:DNA-binding transcriptional regulator YiaG